MISILMLIAYVLMAITVISSAYIVFGENYKFNMTKQERDELFISEMCIAGVEINVTGISECKMLVGSIDTNYGEALK